MKSRRVFVLVLLASMIVGACHPGWAIVVRNETDQEHFVRYADGPSVMVTVGPGAGGLLGIGNAPGPRSVDVLDRECRSLSTVTVAAEGDTVIVIRTEGGSTVVAAEPTTLPRTIQDARLGVVPDGC